MSTIINKTTETMEQLEARLRAEITAKLQAEAEAKALADAPKLSRFQQFLISTEKALVEARNADYKVYEDNKAQNTNVRSNQLLTTVREFLQVTAYKTKADASILTTTYMTNKSVSSMLNTIDYLKDIGLIQTFVITQDVNCWKVDYQLHDDTIKDAARDYLNKTYNLDIPMLGKDNSVQTESRFDFDGLEYDEAGFIVRQ